MKKQAKLFLNTACALVLLIQGCAQGTSTPKTTTTNNNTTSSGGGTTYTCSQYSYYSDPTSCQTATGASCTAVNLGSPSFLTCYSALGGSSSSGSSGSGTCEWQVTDWGTCDAAAKTQTRVVSCLCGSCTNTKPATSRACSPGLYNGVHTEEACASLYVMTNNIAYNYDSGIYAPGAVVTVSQGSTAIRVCKVPVAYGKMDTTWPTCPTGWTRLMSGTIPYNATFARSATHRDCWTCGDSIKRTSFHYTLLPQAREYVDVCTSRNISGCRNWNKVEAYVTHIGCY